MKNNELQTILKDRKGLKFNLNDKSDKRDILFRALENRGIQNPDTFRFPEPNKIFTPSNPFKMYNSEYWVDYLLYQGKIGKNFYIVVDNDADGFSSAGMLYAYLNSVFKNNQVHFLFTEGKNHGIGTILKDILKLENAFVLIPDATVPLKDQYELAHNRIDYLVIDHHDLEDENKIMKDFLPIINNQFSINKSVNKEFTGVGMVYELCKMFDYYLDMNLADELLYFFSIGQVGDVSDVSDLEIRYLTLKGFQKLGNNAILKNTTNIDKASAHELSFSIIPKINATCRTGSLKEKELLMNALVGTYDPNQQVEIKVRRKSPSDNKFHYYVKKVSYYEWIARKLDSIKGRQKRTVKKSKSKLENIYENKSFVIAVDYDNEIASTETGLLATQIANSYQKPTIVLHPTKRKGKLGGSARGFAKVMTDFKEFCLSTKLFDFVAGHPNAFGVGIDEDKLQELLEDFDYDYSEDTSYDVDNVYVNDAPGKHDITEFDNNRLFFGGKITDPKLGFIGLDVGLNVMNFRGSMFTFKFKGISFTMFNTPTELKEKLLSYDKQHIYLDVVGSPNINDYMKYTFPQIIIDDIKFSEPVKNHEVQADVDFASIKKDILF